MFSTEDANLKFSQGTWLLLIVLVGLAARLVLLGYVVGPDREVAGDEIDYHALASNLADGNGYRVADGHLTARRPPLYPIVLSVLYRVFGSDPAVARSFQVVLGALIIWLVFLVSRRLFSPRVAWIAAAFVAVNPFLIFVSGYLLTENLYIVLLLLILVAAPQPGCGWRAVVPTAALLGLCALARPTAAAVALWMVFFVVVLARNSLRKRLAWSFVVVVIAGLIVLPWGARNHRVFGKWLFTTTHGGVTFYQGNNPAVLEYPQYFGGVAPLYMLPGYETLEQKQEIDKDAEARALGWRFLGQNKRRVPVLVWRKFARFWRVQSDAGMSGVKSGWWFDKNSMLGRLASSLDVGLIYAIVVIPLFVIGLLASLGKWSRFVFLYGLVLIHTAVALVFHGSIRMRVPIEPVMAIFAAYAINLFVERMRPREGEPQ